MAVELKHATQAVGTDAGNGEIRKAQWNESHNLTGTPNRTLGFNGSGAAVETYGIVVLTQAAYDALGAKDANILYFIEEV